MKDFNDFPKVVELQLHNLCNSNCIICPYASINETKGFMPIELFKKIIDECSKHSIERIIPYLNNEPFLDMEYISKLQYIRKKMPKVEIEVSTNVSVLDEEKIRDLEMVGITELRLSVFGFFEETHKKMMPGISYKRVMKNLMLISSYFRDSSCLVSITMIDNGKINDKEFKAMEKMSQKLGFNFNKWGFLDRAQNVKDYSNQYYNLKASNCEQKRPLERMHILYDGDVIFCCQDWNKEEVVGNVFQNTISNVWNSKRYFERRESLYNVKLEAPNICKRCVLSASK